MNLNINLKEILTQFAGIPHKKVSKYFKQHDKHNTICNKYFSSKKAYLVLIAEQNFSHIPNQVQCETECVGRHCKDLFVFYALLYIYIPFTFLNNYPC